jgi:hypothetical protein
LLLLQIVMARRTQDFRGGQTRRSLLFRRKNSKNSKLGAGAI